MNEKSKTPEINSARKQQAASLTNRIASASPATAAGTNLKDRVAAVTGRKSFLS